MIRSNSEDVAMMEKSDVIIAWRRRSQKVSRYAFAVFKSPLSKPSVKRS
jgi:hypothetical protein